MEHLKRCDCSENEQQSFRSIRVTVSIFGCVRSIVPGYKKCKISSLVDVNNLKWGLRMSNDVNTRGLYVGMGNAYAMYSKCAYYVEYWYLTLVPNNDDTRGNDNDAEKAVIVFIGEDVKRKQAIAVLREAIKLIETRKEPTDCNKNRSYKLTYKD
jgi:hypothetical protein